MSVLGAVHTPKYSPALFLVLRLHAVFMRAGTLRLPCDLLLIVPYAPQVGL